MKTTLKFREGCLVPSKIVDEFDAQGALVRLVVREHKDKYQVIECRQAYYDTGWVSKIVGDYDTLSIACQIAEAIEKVLGA